MSVPLIRGLLLIGALCIMGCGPDAGTVGDENDPALNGEDEAMEKEMEMQEGDLVDDL